MSTTVAQVNPKNLESAKRQFVELYGSALVMNAHTAVTNAFVPGGLLDGKPGD